MPYSGADDASLPEDVKKQPANKRKAFAMAFNSAMGQHGDEGKAMAIAHAAMNRASESEAEGEKPLKTQYLAEAIDLSEARLLGTDASRTVEVTLIRPGWSSNGRYYSKETLSRAVLAFEGMKAYADHPSKSEEKDRPERSVRDVVGYYEGVKQADDGRLTASYQPVATQAGKDVLALVHEAIARKPDLIGTSILAAGKVKEGEAEGRTGTLVENIVADKRNSVDIVTVPAAGGRFERLAASDDGFTSGLLEAMDFEEWRDVRPDFAKRLREELKTARQTEAVEQRDAEIAQLKEAASGIEERLQVQEAELTTLRADKALREAEAVALAKLDESGLPEAIWDDIKPELIGKPEEDQKRILEREERKLRAVGAFVPKIKGMGQHGNVDDREQKQEAFNEAALGIRDVPAALPGEDVNAYLKRVRETQQNHKEDK